MEPEATVRFAFWGAEELGTWRSAHYVASLGRQVRSPLNIDMVGSRNAVPFVYDAPLAQQVRTAFADTGLATAAINLYGASDHGSFADHGVPVGGLFTGADGLKTSAQARTFGGRADAPYDSCYHLPCDTVANVDLVVLHQMADAAAVAALELAEDGASPARPRVESSPR